MKVFLYFLIAFIANKEIVKIVEAISYDKKNVVIIMSDDMGFHDVSYRGSNEIPTYNIDSLAYNGIILDRFYTSPMCTPSRSALLTGKYPHHNGMQNYVIVSDEPWGLPLDEKLMPEYFQDAGYETHLIGKWHLGFYKEEYSPVNRGFDTFYGYLGPYVDYWDYTLKMFSRNYSRGYDMRRNSEIDRTYKNVYATDVLTKEAIRVIENHDNEKPLFLLLSHLAPHTANDDKPMQAKEEIIEKFSYIENEERRILAAMMHSLDESVGDIIEALYNSNLLNDTIVVFFSDNGGPSVNLHSTKASNYPFRGQKGSGWDGAIRTGAIIYAPFLPSGIIRRKFFYIGDLLPTLLNLANTNIQINKKIDGLDLSNMILYNKAPFRNEIITIDDIFGYSSFIFNGFKLVNGSSSEGFDDGWLGSNNNSDINSSQYISEILRSKVSKYLEIFKHPLQPDNIREIRKRATVQCSGIHNNCNLLNGPCLYDIIHDPCEERNLATPENVFMKIMQEIFITELQHLIPSHRKPPDSKCDPINFNYTWSWWL
ncbi:unnamed protein product [Chironomus riparius]|uniref:Sulfatase N-terminal domain-containing protein n=1 Tax=Chironomus riparius TaxID=315576 RepID=A0A9N9RV25_9DIPT|nr:unnamed protein product [Chironomus riparius]